MEMMKENKKTRKERAVHERTDDLAASLGLFVDEIAGAK
jgi:hypothetical protein